MMTSLSHDDRIDMLSCDQKTSDDSWMTTVSTVGLGTADLGPQQGQPCICTAQARGTRRKGPSINAAGTRNKSMAKQKKIKMAVILVTLALILMCMILVGVTLSMSGHIDDMVRQRYDGLSTTWRPSTNNTTKLSTSAAPTAVIRRAV